MKKPSGEGQAPSAAWAGEVAAMEAEAVRAAVCNTYGQLAVLHSKGKPCGNAKGCCGSEPAQDPDYARQLGYTEDDIALGAAISANLGLGCGNPIAIASLKEGEVVLDLGCGPGFDCFIASQKVGPSGRVIGLDMTEAMVEKARVNAARHGYKNIDFVLGTMENMPVPESSVDVVISNCVINLSPDKMQVLREVARVLKPGGRFVASDVVAIKEIPADIKRDLSFYTGCIAGAISVDQLCGMMEEVGLGDVHIDVKEESRSYIGHWAPGSKAEDYVASADITAQKPIPALTERAVVDDACEEGRLPGILP